METKKAIIIGAVTLIVILTIAVLAMKAQIISYPAKSPSNNIQTATPANQVQSKAGQESAQIDSDVQAIEDDLNSISDEEFSDSNLSDQNLGL